MTDQVYGLGPNERESLSPNAKSILENYNAVIEEIEEPKEEIGLKFDEGKIPWFLLPFKEIGEIVEILGFGANKYGKYNWQKVTPFKERYFSALIRHLVAWHNGERLDPESGKSHLAHAGCNLVFLMWGDNNGKE